MPWLGLTNNVLVESVDDALAFYRDTFGFTVQHTMPPESPFAWGMAARDDVKIMFQTRASLAEEFPEFADKPVGGALTYFILVSDVQAIRQELDGRVEIVKEVHTTFYGMIELAVRDCFNTIVVFAQRSESD